MLILFRVAFLVKIYQSRTQKKKFMKAETMESKAKEVDYGLKWCEFVGKLDPNTLFLKTAQCSFLEASNTSYATFPKSGMCVNGNVYRLRSLGTITRENVYMVLPTPSKSDALIVLQSLESYITYYKNKHQDKVLYQCHLNGMTAEQSMNLYEWMMGFPKNWTKRG